MTRPADKKGGFLRQAASQEGSAQAQLLQFPGRETQGCGLGASRPDTRQSQLATLTQDTKQETNEQTPILELRRLASSRGPTAGWVTSGHTALSVLRLPRCTAGLGWTMLQAGLGPLKPQTWPCREEAEEILGGAAAGTGRRRREEKGGGFRIRAPGPPLSGGPSPDLGGGQTRSFESAVVSPSIE